MNVKNTIKGHVPDGIYDHNTKIAYCCRNDRSPIQKITLPSRKPFYLLMYGRDCQLVKGMTSSVEWVFWDNNDWCRGCSRSLQQGGEMHPRNKYDHENNKLYYCYYQPEGQWNWWEFLGHKTGHGVGYSMYE